MGRRQAHADLNVTFILELGVELWLLGVHGLGPAGLNPGCVYFTGSISDRILRHSQSLKSSYILLLRYFVRRKRDSGPLCSATL